MLFILETSYKRRMLIIEPCAGLSNRILALATAYDLGKKYNHNITLLWDVDDTLGAKIQSLFDLPDDIRVIITTKSPFHQKFILRLKSEILRLWYRKSCDIFLECEDIQELKKNDNNCFIREVLKNHRTIYIKSICELEEICDKKIFSIFQISPEILNKGKEVFGRIKESTIGMHIRRTDHTDAINKSPTELFVKKAEMILSGADNIDIYLATDDARVEAQLVQRFGERIIVHKGKKYSRKNQEGMEDGIIDMLALSKCKEIYGSFGSTFSLMASYIGNKQLNILQRD